MLCFADKIKAKESLNEQTWQFLNMLEDKESLCNSYNIFNSSDLVL